MGKRKEWGLNSVVETCRLFPRNNRDSHVDRTARHAWLLDRLDAFLMHGDPPATAMYRAILMYTEQYFERLDLPDTDDCSSRIPAAVDDRGPAEAPGHEVRSPDR